MIYTSERIVNIAELEKLIEDSYIMAQLLQKESPRSENFQPLIDNLLRASNFEFKIEVRKISYYE